MRKEFGIQELKVESKEDDIRGVRPGEDPQASVGNVTKVQVREST